MLARLASFARSIRNRRQLEADWNAELDAHVEMRAADLERGGLAPEAARRQAALELGARETYREQCREAKGLRVWDELSADLRYALRTLRHAPGFALVAVLTLGVAIATNLAFFTFLDAYVFRPLPVRDGERYVDLEAVNERGERTPGFRGEDLDALGQSLAPAFERLSGSSLVNLPVLEPIRRTVQAQAVSPQFLALFSAAPALGRWLLPAAHLTGGETDAVVLSHAGWGRLFARDPAVVGRRLRLGNRWLTVVGVMGDDFLGVEPVVPDFWLSLAALAELGDGTTQHLTLSGVLRPGTTLDGAGALAWSTLAALGPRGDGNEPVEVRVLPRRSLLSFDERRQVARAGLVLSVAFLLVLLVACANLTGLQLARAGARHREIATRLSLGSSRGRLVRQLVTESLVLAALAAGLALLLVALSTEALERRIFALAIDAGLTVAPVTMSWRSLAAALLLTVSATLATGLAPALQATSHHLAVGTPRDGLVLGTRLRQQKLTGLLISAQVMASLILLTVAALLARNTRLASHLDAGFDPQALVDVRYERPTAEVGVRLAAHPDVAALTGVAQTPLSGPMPRLELNANGASQSIRFNVVDERFFETLGLKLEAGRAFWPEEATAEARIVVVSRATAQRLWPGENPLGKKLEASDPEGPIATGEYLVVGVAPDVVSGLFFQGRDATLVYFPARLGSPSIGNLIVRPRGDAATFTRALPALCTELNPEVICEPKTLAELANMQRFPFLVGSFIAGVLGALALGLTAIGLYGLVDFAVVRRRREMGVRLALGASSGQLLSAVTARALGSVAFGAALGLPLCWLLSLGVGRLLTVLEPFDPLTLFAAPLLLATVAAIAAMIPARRALAADPVESLRIS